MDRRLIRVMVKVIVKDKIVVINRDAGGPFEDRLSAGKNWLVLLARKFVDAMDDIVVDGEFRPIVQVETLTQMEGHKIKPPRRLDSWRAIESTARGVMLFLVRVCARA